MTNTKITSRRESQSTIEAMSGDTDPDEDGHTYGFPSRIRRDRHMQNIIDHTNTLFPSPSYPYPRFSPSDRTSGDGTFMSRLRGEGMDDRELDEFGEFALQANILKTPRAHRRYLDRNLLGRLQRPSYPRGSEYPDQRLSLSLHNIPNQPQRVLGDASRHFGNFASRELDHQSPFSSDTTYTDSIRPSPASRPIFERDVTRRMRGLQPGAQMATPPFYSG